MGRVLHFYEFGDDSVAIIAESVEQAHEFYEVEYGGDYLRVGDFKEMPDDTDITLGLAHTPNGLDPIDATLGEVLDSFGNREVPRFVWFADLGVDNIGDIVF